MKKGASDATQTLCSGLLGPQITACLRLPGTATNPGCLSHHDHLCQEKIRTHQIARVHLRHISYTVGLIAAYWRMPPLQSTRVDALRLYSVTLQGKTSSKRRTSILNESCNKYRGSMRHVRYSTAHQHSVIFNLSGHSFVESKSRKPQVDVDVYSLPAPPTQCRSRDCASPAPAQPSLVPVNTITERFRSNLRYQPLSLVRFRL